MKIGLTITALTLALGLGSTPPPKHTSPIPQEDPEGAAVRDAILDFMDGTSAADADRVAQAIHPEINKVFRMRLSPDGQEYLHKNAASRLVAAARATPPRRQEGETEVTVFEVGHGMAQAVGVSSDFYELFQLVKWDGEWRIMNAIGEANHLPDGSPFPSGDRVAEEAGVRTAALDYIDGYFSGDASRLERGLSVQLHKVRFVDLPERDLRLLDYTTQPLLVEAARAGTGVLPEEERDIQVVIHDISHGLASASITSSRFIDHLHLAKMNGAWKLVNVLWIPNPESLGGTFSRD